MCDPRFHHQNRVWPWAVRADSPRSVWGSHPVSVLPSSTERAKTMSAPSPLFLGLDVGTQSVRAALFDAAGGCRAFAVEPQDTLHPQPGWAEQDALQWWPAARAAVPQALARADASAADVAGIGLDCTACTVLP